MALFHHCHTPFYRRLQKGCTPPMRRCPSPLPSNVGRLTRDRQSSDRMQCKKEEEECRNSSGTHNVRHRDNYSFISTTYYYILLQNQSSTNTASTRSDYVTAISLLLLFLSRLPPTKPSIHPSKSVRYSEGLHRIFWFCLSRILNSHFPPTLSRRFDFILDLARIDLYHSLILSLDFYFAPSYRLSTTLPDHPLPLLDLQTAFAHARFPPVSSLSSSSRLSPLSLYSTD